MRQRELEIRLERVPIHPKPDPNLEQYRTPAKIAADVLYRALARGDIADRDVADLGCGTGIFLVGAGLLGARSLSGVDLDPESIALATQALEHEGLDARLVTGAVEKMDGSFDTAIMNPPFGAQFAQRHADTVFLRHALGLAAVCYSLHLESTRDHIERLAQKLMVDQEAVARYQFPLPHMFKFHTREKVLVPVVLYRFQRMGTT